MEKKRSANSARLTVTKMRFSTFACCCYFLFSLPFSEPKLLLGLGDKFHSLHKPGKGLCTSVECLRSAYELKRSMDTEVDPCQDFYRFACGK